MGFKNLHKDSVLDKNRKYEVIRCKACGDELLVRNDYVKTHHGFCMACLKKGNHYAKKHGKCKSRLYGIWAGLKHRRYKTYIPKVCDEWNNFENFERWALANGYADNLTIDRINNKGDYEPENCRWVTLADNARYARQLIPRDKWEHYYNLRKEMGFTQREMATYLGVSRNTIQRLERGVKNGSI